MALKSHKTNRIFHKISQTFLEQGVPKKRVHHLKEFPNKNRIFLDLPLKQGEQS